MLGSGDRLVRCSHGHWHWGRYGAAGLLLSDGDRVVLHLRSRWTQEGGSWGLPGGARARGEDALATAVREAHEEARIPAGSIEAVGTWVADHGSWSYTTVIARAVGAVEPRGTGRETVQVRWWPIEEVGSLRLHSGLRAGWPALRERLAELL